MLWYFKYIQCQFLNHFVLLCLFHWDLNSKSFSTHLFFNLFIQIIDLFNFIIGYYHDPNHHVTINLKIHSFDHFIFYFHLFFILLYGHFILSRKFNPFKKIRINKYTKKVLYSVSLFIVKSVIFKMRSYLSFID